MPSRKIMIVRHAEKPSDDGTILGVSANGAQNPEELIVRGWQRSGALVRFFAPLAGDPLDKRLATPKVIYADAIEKGSKSLRPQHTVLELATVIGCGLDLEFAKGQEVPLAAQLQTLTKPALLAWQHEAIPTIVNAIVGNATLCPQKWPGDRFDLVWVLDRASDAVDWTFTQVPQMLLSGDSDQPISNE